MNAATTRWGRSQRIKAILLSVNQVTMEWQMYTEVLKKLVKTKPLIGLFCV